MTVVNILAYVPYIFFPAYILPEYIITCGIQLAPHKKVSAYNKQHVTSFLFTTSLHPVCPSRVQFLGEMFFLFYCAWKRRYLINCWLFSSFCEFLLYIKSLLWKILGPDMFCTTEFQILENIKHIPYINMCKFWGSTP